MKASVPRTNRQGMQALVIGLLLLGVYGVWAAPSELALLSYSIIVLAAALPSYLWLLRGGDGIPVLAAFALAHIPYFALPILRGSAAIRLYEEDDVLVAAASVGLFLVAATAAAFISSRPGRAQRTANTAATSAHLHFLVTGGLLTGILFQASILSGWIWWLDTFVGVTRSIALTFCLVACYCLGIAIAQRLVSRRKMYFGIFLLALNALMSWSSLFLVGGMMFILAAALGYVVGSGRVPWKSFLVVFAVVSVLQAGKRDMREEYWYEETNYGSLTGIGDLPNRMLQWAERGIDVIGRRNDGEFQDDVSRQSVLDRTSLLPILLLAQRMTPDVVDYLEGETYALLPKVLMPRFIVPDKMTSQEGMNRLNITYGVLLEHEVEKTAVGWGLISEAYANFGFFGIVGMGLLVGFFCRIVRNRSVGASPVSLPTLLAIAMLLNIVNMEADFTGLVLSMIQSAVAVLIFHGALTIIARRARQRARHAETFALVVRK